MIEWLKTNRLKLFSALAVSGDAMLVLAGGVSVFRAESLSGLLLAIGAGLGLLGHALLFLWGKGGKLENVKKQTPAKKLPVFLRAFVPWYYPLDSSFFLFAISGVFYASAGIISQNIGMMALGVFVFTGCMIGWLWPQEKPIWKFRATQVTAMVFLCATASNFVAGFIARDIIIFMAALLYLASNIILYSVRKQNQSAHTQGFD